MKKTKKRQIIKKLVIGFAIIIGSLALLSAGYIIGAREVPAANSFQLVNRQAGQPQELDFSVFWQVWNRVHSQYFEADSINDQELIRGAIKGMVDALNDPFSVFLPPDEAKNFDQDLEGSFGGVGIKIEMKDQQLTITAPLTDTPGERAGLKSGDIILAIDDKKTEEMGFNEMVMAIRGEVGTKVKLAIYREGWARPRDFNITRERIKVASVKYHLIKKKNIGYLKINQFGSDTEALMDQAAGQIKKDQPRGLILDLRNDPGGYLNVAVRVASFFIEDGLVVKQIGKEGRDYQATGPATLKGYPLVVLINQGSASASEIVAGALRDYGLATLIGQKSFGKGSVQDLIEVQDWGNLRLTVGHWQTPKGEEINKKGIKPDIEVEMDSSRIGRKNDIQLKRAEDKILNNN